LASGKRRMGKVVQEKFAKQLMLLPYEPILKPAEPRR
jgi:hypothetical protein